MSKYETISTHDIKQGDIIQSNGMVLLVDTEPLVSKAHPVTDYGGECIWTPAVVVNFAELEASADDGHSIDRFIVGIVKSDMADDGHRARNGRAPYTEPRWTIQGNGLARWSRLIEEV